MRLHVGLRTLCVVGVVAAFACLSGCAGKESSPHQSQTTSAAKTVEPSLALLDLDGKPFELWPQGSNAVTAAVFTRTDCPISNRFAPEICRLYERYHPRGVNFYLIYVDPREPADAIRQHLREYGYPCLGLRDPKHDLVAHCKATITPEAVVFDKNRTMTYLGRINDLYADVGKARPEPTTHDLADAIEATLLGRPVATARTKAFGCSIADLRN